MDLTDEDLYQDGQEATVTPTAPPDMGSLYVRLHWPEGDLPQRWAHMLQKALQSWFNTVLADEMHITCNIHRLQPFGPPACAVMEVTPFSTLDVLLSKKSFNLTFKELKQTAVVHFYRSADMINTSEITSVTEKTDPSLSSGHVQIPMKVKAVVDIKEFSSQVQAEVREKFKKYSSGAHSLSMQGTFEELNMFYEDLCQTVTQKEQGKNSVTGPQDATCHVPLSQYLVACQTYRKEIELIERENSVEIQAEVTLSFINKGLGRDMRSKACQDITKLLQNCIGTPCSRANLPLGKNFKTLCSPKFPLPSKGDISHLSGLDCPQENSSGKHKHILVETGKGKGQTDGDVTNQESVLPKDQPVGADITTRVPVPGNMKARTSSGGQEKVIIDGQNTVQEQQGAAACTLGFRNAEGDEPQGKMTTRIERESLPGLLGYGTIVIDYDIPNAVQASDHPNPGKPFQGLQVSAYLPDSPEGKHVLELLKKAFSQRLTFTVGVSNCVIWNGISHKTNKYGGPMSNGYPDPHYITQVKKELKAKGIE